MAAVASLLQQRTISARPIEYERLLLEPIVDVASAETTAFGSYVGWDEDHCEARRFYVAGIQWFRRVTHISQTDLYQFRENAHKRILSQTTWHQMPDPQGLWHESLGKPQIAKACKGQPIVFAKAAQVLMACELALEKQLEKSREEHRLPESIKSPQDIHRYMGIFPACWNIDDFGESYIEEARRNYRNGDALALLRDEAGLSNQDALFQLATGATVSYGLANEIKRIASTTFATPSVQLGRVRGRPGRFLGKGHATEREEVQVC